MNDTLVCYAELKTMSERAWLGEPAQPEAPFILEGELKKSRKGSEKRAKKKPKTYSERDEECSGYITTGISALPPPSLRLSGSLSAAVSCQPQPWVISCTPWLPNTWL